MFLLSKIKILIIMDYSSISKFMDMVIKVPIYVTDLKNFKSQVFTWNETLNITL